MKRKTTRVTSYDVAKLAGVSQPTVSRAFTPNASIAKDKRDRVLAAAKQLHYLPNSIAASLSSARSNIVAVIVGDMHNPFYSESLQAFINRLQATNRQVLAFTVEDGRDCDAVLMQALRYHVDGIVVTSANLSSDLISLSREVGIPIALFNRSTSDPTLTSVRCDSVQGGGLLADAMFAAGAQSYLIVRGDPQGSTSRLRVKGFRDALASLGIDDSAITEIDGGSSYAGSYRAISNHFDSPAPRFPDAIFAVNDIMAIGCIDALRAKFNIAIPGDIMLAGFDGIREGRLGPYHLTTVRQPIEDMVTKTLDLLGRDNQGEKSATQVNCVLPGIFIPGRTVPGLAEIAPDKALEADIESISGKN